jgi:hypothetical protein
MSTTSRYVASPGPFDWTVNGATETAFRWEYDDGRAELLALYDKGKKQQWDAQERIDWSQELDPVNPMQLPDETISIAESDLWRKLPEKTQAEFRRHQQAWTISGRADLRRQDRAAGAQPRFEVLRFDPGGRRSAPCRGLLAAAA